MSENKPRDGDRLRAARLACGLPQARLADEAGVDRHTVSRIERNLSVSQDLVDQVWEALERLADRAGATPWLQVTPELAATVKTLRKQRGWNQRQLAELAGCGPDTISRIELQKLESSRKVRPILQVLIDPEMVYVDPPDKGDRHGRLEDGLVKPRLAPPGYTSTPVESSGHCRCCQILLFEQPDQVPTEWITENHLASGPAGDRCPMCARRYQDDTCTCYDCSSRRRRQRARRSYRQLEETVQLSPGVLADLWREIVKSSQLEPAG